MSGRAGYRFLCLLPGAPPDASGKRPLILFLHGACPDEDLEKLKHFGPIQYGREHPDFPFIVVCPASSQFWSVPTLIQLLNHIQTTFPVDHNRVYVTGYSNGGHGTWLLACAYPLRFAAIAPVAGAGNPSEAARKLQHLPVWVFHGAKDKVVAATAGQAMANALKQAGGQVEVTIYPDRGHDTWGPPYAGRELYDWFLRHRRTGAPAVPGPQP